MKLELQINPEFEEVIPPAGQEEFKQLEENIVAEGELLMPIIIWNGYIIDGHSRYKILKKHPEIKNNSLFAYTLVLLKRLPDERSKKSLIQTVEAVIDEYRDDIDLNLIGFPEKYLEIMENNL